MVPMSVLPPRKNSTLVIVPVVVVAVAVNVMVAGAPKFFAAVGAVIVTVGMAEALPANPRTSAVKAIRLKRGRLRRGERNSGTLDPRRL